MSLKILLILRGVGKTIKSDRVRRPAIIRRFSTHGKMGEEWKFSGDYFENIPLYFRNFLVFNSFAVDVVLISFPSPNFFLNNRMDKNSFSIKL